MEVLHDLVSAELELWEGYLVSTSQGCLIAAFLDPARAIRCVARSTCCALRVRFSNLLVVYQPVKWCAETRRWALCTIRSALTSNWPQELLQHELGGAHADPAISFQPCSWLILGIR